MTNVKKFERGGVQVQIKEPNVVLHYIKFMGGVDRADQYVSTYYFLRKSLKWWRKLFFWGVEICVINSFILYKLGKYQRNERPLSHLKYVKLLINQLKGDFQENRGASTSTDTHASVRLNRRLHVILTGKVKDCRVCSHRTGRGKRHQTTYLCDTCPKSQECTLASAS